MITIHLNKDQVILVLPGRILFDIDHIFAFILVVWHFNILIIFVNHDVIIIIIIDTANGHIFQIWQRAQFHRIPQIQIDSSQRLKLVLLQMAESLFDNQMANIGVRMAFPWSNKQSSKIGLKRLEHNIGPIIEFEFNLTIASYLNPALNMTS